jgi:hypothetical protein
MVICIMVTQVPNELRVNDRVSGIPIKFQTPILRRIDPLLGNDFGNIFPRKRRRATIGRPLLGNVSVNKSSQQ